MSSELGSEAGRYQHAYVEGGSYRAAVALLDRSGRRDGVVVDLGCGFGAVAEPVAALGFTYVGTDLASEGLADLAGRGFETHELDLRRPDRELRVALDAIVAGRPLAFVLALDVLEHLAEPGRVAAALAELARDANGGADATPPGLIVSYPNVTHLDVAAKLLLGRWERTDEGLLDRTHLQFFAERDLVALLAAAGWRVADVDDVISEHSDQARPDESPVLRPGAPLRDLLRTVRRRAEPSGATYQFVRRYEVTAAEERRSGSLEPETSESEAVRFASVVVPPLDPAIGSLVRSDLAEQSHAGFEVVELAPGDDLGAAVAAAAADGSSRYVVVVTGAERLEPGWLAAFVDAAGDPNAVGRVLRVGVLDDPEDPASGDATPLALESFDPVSADPPGAVVPGAYAVPSAVVSTLGLQPSDTGAGLTAFLARCVQVAGLAAVDAPAVRLRGGAPVPGFDADEVLDALGAETWLLPAGAGPRLLELRAAAADARATEQRLQIELLGALEHARGIGVRHDERAEALAAQLVRLQAEHDAALARLAELTPDDSHGGRDGRGAAARIRASVRAWVDRLVGSAGP